ncbi:MAG: hypothetical protein V2I33_17990 [Kangiellaceae bacterium]|jgi:hypothetical protein|nr:hypothetical protein [Kangiellaceae bacterium]
MELRKLKWEKLKAKVTFAEPEKGYYKNSPIQPGFNFMKNIFMSTKVKPSGLDLRIPETLFIDEKVLWASYDETAKAIQVRSDF